MTSLQDIFDSWNSIREMAADLGETHWAVKKWRQRRRIPSPAWPRVIAALRAKGQNVSADDLVAAHSPPKKPSLAKIHNRPAA